MTKQDGTQPTRESTIIAGRAAAPSRALNYCLRSDSIKQLATSCRAMQPSGRGSNAVADATSPERTVFGPSRPVSCQRHGDVAAGGVAVGADFSKLVANGRRRLRLARDPKPLQT